MYFPIGGVFSFYLPSLIYINTVPYMPLFPFSDSFLASSTSSVLLSFLSLFLPPINLSFLVYLSLLLFDKLQNGMLGLGASPLSLSPTPYSSRFFNFSPQCSLFFSLVFSLFPCVLSNPSLLYHLNSLPRLFSIWNNTEDYLYFVLRRSSFSLKSIRSPSPTTTVSRSDLHPETLFLLFPWDEGRRKRRKNSFRIVLD